MLDEIKYDSQPEKYFQELINDIFIMANYARELGRDIPNDLQYMMDELFNILDHSKNNHTINKIEEIEK